MPRGSGMPPSEAPNRADEWSFSLCCVAIFLLAVCGSTGAPSETSRPRFSVRSITRTIPRLAIIFHRYDNLYCLRCALFGCTRRGRSFAYMWGAGLRAHLKFSALRGKICTQRARRVVTHAAAPCGLNRSTRHKERILMKERNRGMLTAAAGDYQA